jgi:cleavage and polyadenylation specificity factor subunit 4
MEDIIANVRNHIFDFEKFIYDTYGPTNSKVNPLNLSGASTEICQDFLNANCSKGILCPYRHTNPATSSVTSLSNMNTGGINPSSGLPKNAKTVVCKHWLRGLCKKEDACEFLHEYNLKRMPECYFFSKFGECNNLECMYLHINPESKIKECPWYTRGFCKNGPNCRQKHIKRAPCPIYLTGFCPEGPNCKLGHPKYEAPLIAMQKWKQFLSDSSLKPTSHDPVSSEEER